jgi:hypothetical protein
MTWIIGLKVYFGLAILLGLVACVYDGRRGYDDPASGVICAFMWPLFVIIAPFWLAYRLGKFL